MNDPGILPSSRPGDADIRLAKRNCSRVQAGGCDPGTIRVLFGDLNCTGRWFLLHDNRAWGDMMPWTTSLNA